MEKRTEMDLRSQKEVKELIWSAIVSIGRGVAFGGIVSFVFLHILFIIISPVTVIIAIESFVGNPELHLPPGYGILLLMCVSALIGFGLAYFIRLITIGQYIIKNIWSKYTPPGHEGDGERYEHTPEEAYDISITSQEYFFKSASVGCLLFLVAVLIIGIINNVWGTPLDNYPAPIGSNILINILEAIPFIGQLTKFGEFIPGVNIYEKLLYVIPGTIFAVSVRNLSFIFENIANGRIRREVVKNSKIISVLYLVGILSMLLFAISMYNAS